MPDCSMWGQRAYRVARAARDAGLISGRPCLDSPHDPFHRTAPSLGGLAIADLPRQLLIGGVVALGAFLVFKRIRRK